MQAIRFIKPISFVLSGRNHHELSSNRLQRTGCNSLPLVSSCHTTAMSAPSSYYHYCLLSELNDEDEINSFDDSFHLAEL